VAAFAAVSLGLLAAYVAAFRGEVSSLVCGAAEKVGAPPLEAVRVGFPTGGFDGQFYYAIARDPWAPHPEFVDLPAYRHTRIVLPAVAHAVTGGDAVGLLWAFPAINLLSLIGLAGLGTRLATHFGHSPWWGFAFPLALNALGGAFRDLTDPVSTFLCCGLVTSYVCGGRVISFVIWGTLAVLSREQNVAVVGLVATNLVIGKRYRAGLAMAIPALALTAWVLILKSWYGHWPTAPGNTGMPFDGFRYRFVRMTGGRHTGESPTHLLAMGTLTLHLLLSAWLFMRTSPWLPRFLAALGFALAAIAGESVYMNLESYTRVFWWMPLGVWLGALQSGKRWPLWLLCTSAIWPVYSVAQAWSFHSRGIVTYL
jgi:hypothetical protein